ncbi:uncharacterized 2Fe-2S/4Fe-4S cluster protein (DUF4445 family) [Desulfitispora alkaliphila]|uniref:ASKHA domain-containing protein n=1 Tax=Desulfitispora alkaliphila TaxID=622674 RepID=UPI003D1D6B4C
MKNILSQGKELSTELDPLTVKVFKSLSPPSLQDNRGDADRIRAVLSPHCENLEIPLPLLNSLPNILRQSHWQVTLTMGKLKGRYQLLQVEPGDTTSNNWGVAVDIGTTTVVAYLVDLVSGETTQIASNYNGQVKYGENILTRIQHSYTEEGKHQLQQSIIATLNSLIEEVAQLQNISARDITAAAFAGNTTMIHMLLGLDASQVCKEPYIPVINSPDIITASQLNLNMLPHGLIYFVPSIGSYVGGDVIAGVLVSGMHKSPETSLLVDIGTNGEKILGNQEWLVACAGAAGPALEGGVVQQGMRAEPGAIEKIQIDPQTKKVSYNTVNNISPKGLCGSGLVDCLAQMLLSGIVDRKGYFKQNTNSYTLVSAEESANGLDICISQSDLKNLIRTKGAVNASISVLLEAVGCPMEDIKHFYTAGAFGNYLDTESAITIGLYPDLPRERIVKLGNSSGTGAKLALLSQQKRQELEEIARRITYFEMNANQDFMNKYTSGLFLPHSNLELYPSIKEKLNRNPK